MQRAHDFLRKHHNVALATVRDGKPVMRVFQIMKQTEDKLYFATDETKEVYAQLKENPSMEVLGMAASVFVKMSGKAVFEVPEEECREIFESNPLLRAFYQDYRNMKYFYMPIEHVFYYDLSTTPPTQEVWPK